MHLERASKTIALLAALRAGGRARAERLITANPSDGHFVHYENTASLGGLGFPPDLSVTSNVPVTLARYSDSGRFYDGQKPVRTNEATVVVKSDCSTDVTDVIPQVEISEDGLISVLVSGVDGIAGSGMPFLDEPSFYSVFWTYFDDFCGGGGFFTPPATVGPDTLPAEQVLVSETDIVQCVKPGTGGIIAICNGGEYCAQEVGVCEKPWGPPTGKCTEKRQICEEIWAPVCGCDARIYSNACEASRNGVSVNYEGECSATGGKPAVEVIPPVEQPIIAEVVTIPSIPQEPETSSSTPGTPATTDAAVSTTTTTTTSIASSDETTASATVEIVAGISTEAASSNAATTEGAKDVTQAPVSASGEATPEQDSAGVGEVEPSEINSEPDEFSSGFVRRRPSSFYAAFVLLAVVALASLFPTTGNGGLIGKFAVVALAVSSHRGRNSGSQTSPHKNKRVLQTCSYNVEVLYDACAHSVNVQAPKTRTVDAVVGDVSRSSSAEDECIKELATNLTFPSSDAEELNGTDITVAQYEQFVSDRCLVIAIGRPFVDDSGSSLVAPPYVHESESSFAISWMGDASSGDGPSTFPTNSTPPSLGGDYHLVHEWTRRGLAEHASVASFAAFNVALMTNGAPSDLVEESLRAALDEVRHTKISFDVVFKLSGKQAGPGSLPESSLEFTQDIKAMGMAVAREGCLDETLSAFDAKMESDHISKLLNGEAIESHYSTIDRDTLTWIRNELKTIASDESEHAALAWKTLRWLCSDNKDVCGDIMRDVFDKDRVEQRIRQRAAASLMDTSFAFEYMRAEWNGVYAAFRAGGNVDSAPSYSVSSSIID